MPRYRTYAWRLQQWWKSSLYQGVRIGVTGSYLENDEHVMWDFHQKRHWVLQFPECTLTCGRLSLSIRFVNIETISSCATRSSSLQKSNHWANRILSDHGNKEHIWKPTHFSGRYFSTQGRFELSLFAENLSTSIVLIRFTCILTDCMDFAAKIYCCVWNGCKEWVFRWNPWCHEKGGKDSCGGKNDGHLFDDWRARLIICNEMWAWADTHELEHVFYITLGTLSATDWNQVEVWKLTHWLCVDDLTRDTRSLVPSSSRSNQLVAVSFHGKR